MTSIQEHKRKLREHFEEIEEAIDKGIEKRPATIGFHCSAAAIELLEMYLHKINLISVGKMIKHNWFERPKPGQKIAPLIERKLPVTFPDQEKVNSLLYTIEEARDTLIYGKSGVQQIELVLRSFNELKKIILKKLEELGEAIE